MAVKRGAVPLAVVLAALTFALSGCGIGGDDEPAEEPDRAPAEEAATRSRERVQAYLDAMVAKDVAAGRSQFCATAHAAFDAAATSPNGDFAEHFTVPAATVTDVRSGARGQEVSASVTVSVGGQSTTRALVFTVTRTGADWCIADEVPGDPTAPGASPGATVEPSASSAP
ncbi:hypothetical protein [Micromonospora echinospora]|uniref:hypothetical protein n=1 Tax=Micromonospora echinospora TaxID=1877 RepID=UPI003A8424AA